MGVVFSAQRRHQWRVERQLRREKKYGHQERYQSRCCGLLGYPVVATPAPFPISKQGNRYTNVQVGGILQGYEVDETGFPVNYTGGKGMEKRLKMLREQEAKRRRIDAASGRRPDYSGHLQTMDIYI